MLKVIALLIINVMVAKSEMSVKHFYVSRKARSNEAPVEAGYVYSKTGNSPANFATFGYNGVGDYHMNSDLSKARNDMERMKSLSNYELSRNIGKTNAMFDVSKKFSDFDFGTSFNMDDEDVRTNSRNLYDYWPYHYSTFEPFHNIHSETVKDKRYAAAHIDIKPVHEFVDEEMPNDLPYLHTERYMRDVQYTTPYPYIPDPPLNSYVINDNYDSPKYNDEDSFNFKGLDINYLKDSIPMTPYINYNYGIGNKHKHIGDNGHNSYLANEDVGKYVTEKAYDRNHKFDKHEKGNNDKEHHNGEYNNYGQKHNEFKHFADTFGNKFSNGNEHKDSIFKLSKNAHKGEKKKGFHRVYHKNEYQEDNEFFDNNENKANALEKGGIHHNAGHSNGIIHSDAVASLGNEGLGYKNAGGINKDRFENNHNGHNLAAGSDRDSHTHVNLAHNVGKSHHGNYGSQIYS